MLLSAIKKRSEIFPGIYSDLWLLESDLVSLRDDLNHYTAEMIIDVNDLTMIINGAAYINEFFNLRYLEIHFVDKFGFQLNSFIKLNLEFKNYKSIEGFYKLNFIVKRVVTTEDIVL